MLCNAFEIKTNNINADKINILLKMLVVICYRVAICALLIFISWASFIPFLL